MKVLTKPCCDIIENSSFFAKFYLTLLNLVYRSLDVARLGKIYTEKLNLV